MPNHEIDNFWKEIKKQSKSKAAISNCIDGVTGECDIADVWRKHYGDILNSCNNDDEKIYEMTCFENGCLTCMA